MAKKQDNQPIEEEPQEPTDELAEAIEQEESYQAILYNRTTNLIESLNWLYELESWDVTAQIAKTIADMENTAEALDNLLSVSRTLDAESADDLPQLVANLMLVVDTIPELAAKFMLCRLISAQHSQMR